MFIKINSEAVINTSDIESIQQSRVDGPCEPKDWFVFMTNGKKHRVKNIKIDELIEIINKG